MKKINALFIAPGPTYNADSSLFKAKYSALSPFLNSYLLTTSDKTEEIRRNDFVYHSMQRGRRFINLKFVIFCLRKAIKLKDRGGIDCIITYDPLKTGFIGILLKKILRAKLIVEVNGVYTSPVVWEDEHECLSKHIKQWIIPKLMRFVFNFSDGIKLQFPTQVDQFHKTTAGKTIVIFSSWVPTSKFVNIKEKKELLLVGFPFRIKGVDILIESFKRIAAQFPDWSLKILGWYPDMNELSAAIGGHPQIIHHPPVSYYEMVQHIGECGIFVLPSRTDARPRVLIEAAAAGKPRVGANVDGIPMLIDDGVDGFLVESENVEKLALTLERLMGDPDLRKKIGTIAQNRAKVEFSEDGYVDNMLDLLKSVLAR